MSGPAARILSRAAGSPLVRGGLTIGAGIILGNLTGFLRVALTAYLLGTHSTADSLAVAIGPLDTLNAILINSFVFAFVPMLTERRGAGRAALFVKLNRFFFRLLLVLTAAVILFTPWLIRVLAPGLDPAGYPAAEWNLRLSALSILAVGAGAVRSALLYTDRRFAPSAFYQVSLNICTILSAVLFWRVLGVQSFALGYAAGAWVQFVILWAAVRRSHSFHGLPESPVTWREMAGRPAYILVYSGLVALNVIFSRAYSTAAGPGMAAALDYTMRCIGVPLAFLVMPVSNSLLPEIARLRSLDRIREAFRLIDKTTALVALAAVAGTAAGVAFRRPIIALLFERGSFTAESTQLVSAVFLGFAPSLIGWSLLELTSRTLFALDQPWLPVLASALPVAVNVAVSLSLRLLDPRFIGLGASLGFLAGFFVLIVLARIQRARRLTAGMN